VIRISDKVDEVLDNAYLIDATMVQVDIWSVVKNFKVGEFYDELVKVLPEPVLLKPSKITNVTFWRQIVMQLIQISR
jgi:hypothetical protein